MRQNGLVMEMKGKKAVVLGKDGRFYTTAAQSGWGIGQEVSWDPNLTRRPYRVPIWQKTLAAGTAACLLLGGGFWYAVQHSTVTRAYAYVSVDINPSILYTLNHQERVIRATGLNRDGKTLLTHFHPKGEGLQQVLNDTIKTAVLSHMLPKRDTILVTASPIHAHVDVSTLMSMARADMEQAVTMNKQAAQQDPSVYSIPVSAAVSQAAQKLNVSPGKLVAYLAAQKAGQNVQMKQLHGQVLKGILTNAQLPSVLSTIQSDNAHQIEDWMAKAMSVTERSVAQKQKTPNTANNNANVADSSHHTPAPTKSPSASSSHSQAGKHHSQTAVGKQHSSTGKSNGKSNGNGKHKGKQHKTGSAKNNGKHTGQKKHDLSGAAPLQNGTAANLAANRSARMNQYTSRFLRKVMNMIESMRGHMGREAKPNSSFGPDNRSTSYKIANQIRSDASTIGNRNTSGWNTRPQTENQSGDNKATVQFNDTSNGSVNRTISNKSSQDN